MENETILKKCPFCGNEAKLIQNANGHSFNPLAILNRYHVECCECKISTPTYESKIYQDSKGEVHIDANGAELAIEVWNRRT